MGDGCPPHRPRRRRNLATSIPHYARRRDRSAEQRDALVAVGLEPPGSTAGPLAAQWDAIASWADDVRPGYEKQVAELDDLAAAKTAEREAAYGDLRQRATVLGAVAPGEHSVAALTLSVTDARHDADEALRNIERVLGRVASSTWRSRERVEQELVANELGRLLESAISASGSSTKRCGGWSWARRRCSIACPGVSTR